MKSKNSLLLYAAAALVLAACDNDESETDNRAGEIRLTSGLTVQQTRATDGIHDSEFSNGEKIDVYIYEVTSSGLPATDVPGYELPLEYTAGGGKVMTPPEGKQPYFPASGNGVNIFALYPANISLATEETAFTVKQDQSSDENYRLSDLMLGAPEQIPVARTSSNIELKFEHGLSKMTINLKAGTGVTEEQLKKAKVEIPDAQLAVNFKVDEFKSLKFFPAEESKAPVTVKSGSPESLSGCAILVPQTLPAKFVRVTLAEGGVLTGSLDNGEAPKLESGKAYTYTITVNLTSLSVESSIAPWGDSTDANGTAEML